MLLATGIYPPAIGGPATYVVRLAQELHARGVAVQVLTYGEKTEDGRWKMEDGEPWPVQRVSRAGGPFARWGRYSKALQVLSKDADILYAFSSVSVGVPLLLARVHSPHKVLRLGGDFLWERATDRGETRPLAEWYEQKPKRIRLMNSILRTFDSIIFSTRFQEQLYERCYRLLPLHRVIENAYPEGVPVHHESHAPFRLLYYGRFVGFKNLFSLLSAVATMPEIILTLVGEGPLCAELRSRASALGIADRVTMQGTAHVPQEREAIFAEHDLLILPSFTEISPNAALEARATGLPVLLTEATGLSIPLVQGMMRCPLYRPEQIVRAVQAVLEDYPRIANAAAVLPPVRSWADVAEEHLTFFRSLL